MQLRSFGEKNPFTPKAFLIRYWDRAIHNNLPKPSFLLSKASPLTAVDTVAFAKLAAGSALSTRLREFCSSAHLLCFPNLQPSFEDHTKDSNFAVYRNKNFTDYGAGRLGGADSFRNYSDSGVNVPVDDFRRYSHNSTARKEHFLSYGSGGNGIRQSFHVYSAGASGGAGEFNRYADPVFGSDFLRFSSYSDHVTDGRTQSFSSYSENGNSGDHSFHNYGHRGHGAISEFTSYGTSSNFIVSGFSHYGEDASAANNTFMNYEADANDVTNTFDNYGGGGNGATDSFSSYRDQANGGSDSFQSYAAKSKSANVDFAGYDIYFNLGSDTFTAYGIQGAKGQNIGFKGYKNVTFKDYAKEGINFARYTPVSSELGASMATSVSSGRLVNKWVGPGKFFREAMLKEGTIMPMPDIRDKMPERSFLPRSILSKLPFLPSELKNAFNVADGSAMDKIIKESLNDCARPPSKGETKRCVGSIEDMIDFSTSVLGPNITVRTTDNVNGSNQRVMLGRVREINDGRVTESVSCHQSLFPYLLYYCHSVPKVRVYEADLLDPNSKVKINHGVAICHLDTTAWSPSHGAFLALGPGPGRIEVCHWIFENDMTWTIAD